MKLLFLHSFLFIQVLGYASALDRDFILKNDTIIPQRTEMPVTFPMPMPQYPGGEVQLLRDLQDNLVYPKAEKAKGIQGVVMVEITVEADGSLSNIKVVRSIKEANNFDNAAVRAVKKLKKFTPAKNNKGEPTRISMILPVRFKLPEETSQNRTVLTDTTIHDYANEMPEYLGGTEAMLEFISKNIEYPKYEKENNIQGRVIVEFTVEEDTSISNVKTVGNVPGAKNLSQEAKRVIKMLKFSKPAYRNSKPTQLNMAIPIRFEIPKEEPKEELKK